MRSFVAALYLLAYTSVVALPDGAPICAIGDPNVRNVHLAASRKPKTGAIQVGGFDIFIDGQPLVVAAGAAPVAYPFLGGVNHTLTVKSSTGAQFRGTLVLLSVNRTPSTPTKAYLSNVDNANYESALGCEGLPHVGLSHSDKPLKSVMNMNLFWPNTTGDLLNLDVNIVVANNASSSIHYWNQYKIRAVAEIQRCRFLWRLLRRC